MANGAFNFKDNSGNVVSFISGSGSDIIISGGTLDLSSMTGLTLGNLTMEGTVETASFAPSYLLTSSFDSYTGTTDNIIGSLQTSTSSLNSFTSSAGGRLDTIEGVTGSYATTGSNTFNGNLTVTGYIDAQELRTTYISSSILYRSGSTKFGDELSDTHAFTGSMLLSGSLTTTNQIQILNDSLGEGAQIILRGNVNRYNVDNWGGNALRIFREDDSTAANGNVIIFASGSGQVGINKNGTNATLDVNGSTIVSGSLTTTSTITGTNFVTNGTTLYGVTLRGRSEDNYGAIGLYSSDGVTRYGYVQSHSSNGGQLNITSDGGGQVIMDNRGVVVTTDLSGSAAVFSSNVGTTALNMNNMASLGSIGGGSIYLPHTAVIMFRTTDGATARGKITADNSNNLLLNSDNGGYVGIGNSTPSFPLEVTTNTSTTVSIATFHNLDYTVGTKSFIRVRAQTSAVSSYSSYFGTAQDGTLHITANNFDRGGDIKINPEDGNITTSGTINGLSLPNDLFAQQFLLMGS